MPLRVRSPRRLFVYCHDGYGMGNARRMMALAGHLVEHFPDASLLMASGSPVIHGFRLPDRVDYIKLPSVARTDREQYEARSLHASIDETIGLRRALLTAAVNDFRPDLVLVDKKPLGLMHELSDALRLLRERSPHARCALVLRDILDAPAATISSLAASGFERDVNAYFDLVAVLGTPDVFDLRQEYRLSSDTAANLRYCGYIRSAAAGQPRHEVRAGLGARHGDALVLVTTGGGEDGRALLDTSMAALERLGHACSSRPVKGVMITGPHVTAAHLAELRARAAAHGGTVVLPFTDDMSSFVAAADVVVAMGGYNTVCDILSLAARAIVVPRVRPVREQAIRAARMAQLGYFTAVEPDGLSGDALARTIARELAGPPRTVPRPRVNLDGLAGFAGAVDALFQRAPAPVVAFRPATLGQRREA